MRKLIILIFLLKEYAQNFFENYPSELIYLIISLTKSIYENDRVPCHSTSMELSTSETKLFKKMIASTRGICDDLYIEFSNNYVKLADNNFSYFRDKIPKIKLFLEKEAFDTLFCNAGNFVTLIKTNDLCDIFESINDSSLIIIYHKYNNHEPRSCLHICSQTYDGNNTHAVI